MTSSEVSEVMFDDDAGLLVRHTVARSLAQLLHHDPGARRGEPEDIHKFRVATRRLRSDLRTFRPLLDDAWMTPLRDELKWLGGEVGPVRDKDVLLARLEGEVTDLLADDPAAVEVYGAPADELLDQFRAQRAVAHAELHGTLLGPRYAALLGALVEAAEAPALAPGVDTDTGPDAEPADGSADGPTDHDAAEHHVRERAVKMARRPWRRLRQAVDDLPDDPPDDDLHHVRILAKRSRYAAEAVADVVGPEAERFADAVADLQTVLGDHQDTVVAEEALTGAAQAFPHLQPVVDTLVERERASRHRLRTEWPDVWRATSRKELRRWMQAARAPAPPAAPVSGV